MSVQSVQSPRIARSQRPSAGRAAALGVACAVSLFAVAACGGGSSHSEPAAAGKPAAAEPEQNTAGQAVIAKADWIQAMRTALPAAFCPTEGYFRACFAVSGQECVDNVLNATLSCMSEIEAQLPAELVQPADGAAWGEKLGACVGTVYETILKAKMVQSPECDAALEKLGLK